MTERKIEDNLDQLNKLEKFDRGVFVGDSEYSQEFCNFFLALAMIWNDHKTLMLFWDHMATIIPENSDFDKPQDMPEEPIWGERSGIKVYLEKSLVALVFEFFKTVQKSKSVVDSPAFEALLKKMLPKYRSEWKQLVQYAIEGTTKNSLLGKALSKTRSKIVNHYDMGELKKGYTRKFFEQSFTPYISQGNSMSKTRFYFADAAAQEYYHSQIEGIGQEKFFSDLNTIWFSMNSCISGLIRVFIRTKAKNVKS